MKIIYLDDRKKRPPIDRTLDTKIDRIRASLDRIDYMMHELRGTSNGLYLHKSEHRDTDDGESGTDTI